MRGKKIIVNQTLLSKLWYIAKFVLFQNIAKKNIRFLLDQEKIRPPRNLAQFSIWIWARYFGHRDTIKLSKNKMDSKVIKSYQCSMEKCHGVSSIELNSEL